MIGLKTLTIDGKPLLDFGVWTNGPNAWNAAEPDVTTISVPGRNGELIISNGRYKNISVSYECLMRRDFRHRFDELRAFLLSKPGYRRIEDQREPEYYREGRITGGLTVSDVLWTSNAGIFRLTFSFKPQRFLKRGEVVRTMTSDGIIYNPTLFDAKPKIRVYGSGNFRIGEKAVIISNYGRSYMDIDFETMNAFFEDMNLNKYVKVDGDFPVLKPGDNQIVVSVPRMEITPRWWTI